MAMKLQNSKPLNAVQIISQSDDAVDHAASDWDAYAEDLDPSHLKMIAGQEPTVFLCNFELTAKERAGINDALITGVDGEGKPKVGLGTWQLTVARTVLRDIINPASVPEAERIVMKKHGAGYADDKTLNMLSKFGVVQEIHAHFTRHTEGGARQAAKN